MDALPEVSSVGHVAALAGLALLGKGTLSPLGIGVLNGLPVDPGIVEELMADGAEARVLELDPSLETAVGRGFAEGGGFGTAGRPKAAIRANVAGRARDPLLS